MRFILQKAHEMTENPESTNPDRSNLAWLILAIGLLPLIAYGLPLDNSGDALRGLDPAKVKLGLAVFACIGLLWLSEAMPLPVTALMVPVLATSLGLMDMKSALAGFADPLIFLFLGGFALASALSHQGLDRWIADRIIRAGRGDFLKVSYLLFGVTALLSMWVSNTATTAMMLPLALGILRHLPAESDARRNGVYLLLGVAYSASVGGIGTLVGSPPNGIAAAQLKISFIEWMKFGVPAVLVLQPLLIFCLRGACRPEALQMREMTRMDFRLNRARLITLSIFVATATCWIFSAPLAKALGVAGSFDTLVVLAAVLALVCCRVVNWKEINAGTEWGVLLLFGGGITLSALLSQTGASVLMARIFSGWVTGWPEPLIIAAVIAFIIFLSELASNTALAALMVPIFYSVSGELGIESRQLVLPLALAASCGFMLPVGTPPNGIVFASGLVPQREMIRIGFRINLVFVAALSVLAQFLF
jgi:sodium-dependent dicarboxylate transporter 2/3/5